MNIYFEAFGLFSKIGLFTIGGGYAMVPLIEEEIVDKRKWIAKDDFIDLLAISQCNHCRTNTFKDTFNNDIVFEVMEE